MLARVTALRSSLTRAALLLPAPVPGPEVTAAAMGAAHHRSPPGVVVATGDGTDHPRRAVGPLIPGPAPTLVATDVSPAVAAKPIAEKATDATEDPRRAATRFALIQTAARLPRLGPHGTEMTDPAPDHQDARADTGGQRGQQNARCPLLHQGQLEAPHSLHSLQEVPPVRVWKVSR